MPIVIKPRLLLAAALGLGCTLVHAATPGAETAALDKIVDATVTRYHLPGIAVGVIENGQVVYTRTMGETVAGSGRKITPQTLFKIASNSKAMTTALLGRL
ncbi:MAG: serine hydrolase domain-containing protein, partial [Rhodanobacter sp.]